MEQAQTDTLTHGENTWRSHTELQKQRNTTLLIITRSEKIEFIKWTKAFDADPLNYIRVYQGQFQFPTEMMARILALGYLSDISEFKRLHDEENQTIKWTPIPFGFTKEEWDNPEIIKETIMDRYTQSGVNDNKESDEESESPIELGKNMNNLLEEVADDSESEHSYSDSDSDSEIEV